MLRYSRYIVASMAIIVLYCFPSLAQSDPSSYYQRRSLEGQRSFEVSVWPAVGINSGEVKRAVTNRLVRAGIKPDMPGENPASLAARIIPKCKGDVCAASVSLEFMQIARLGDERIAAPTWRRFDAVVAEKDLQAAYDRLREMVDEFISDFRVANP